MIDRLLPGARSLAARAPVVGALVVGALVAAVLVPHALAAQQIVDARLVPLVVDFENGTWRTELYAQDASGRSWSLAALAARDPRLERLAAGSPLRLTVPDPDRPDDDVIAWQPTLETGALSAPGAAGDVPANANAFADLRREGAYRVLVVPCAFSDVGPLDVTPATFAAIMGDAFPGVGAFVSAASRGRSTLEGTRVSAWMQLARPVGDFYVGNTTAAPAGFPNGFQRDLAFATGCVQRAMAADASIDLNAVDMIQLNHSHPVNASYAYLGSLLIPELSTTRRFRLAVNASWAALRAGTQAHELGHTLGLPHTSGPYGATYDSKWDVMSNSSHANDAATGFRFGTLFNAHHRTRLGWIEDAEILMLADGTRDTLDLQGAATTDGGRRVVRVTTPGAAGTRVLTIESRRRDATFESALPIEGVVLHGITNNYAIVIDRDGDGDPNDEGAALQIGDGWTDELSGVRVTVLDTIAGGHRIVVARDIPFLLTSEDSVRLQVGRPSAFAFAVSGGRGDVTITSEAPLPAGLGIDPASRLVIGTPTASVRDTLVLRATDGEGREAIARVALTIDSRDAAYGPFARPRRVGVPATDTLVQLVTGADVRGASDVQLVAPTPAGGRLRTVAAGDATYWVFDWTPTIDTTHALGVRLGASSPIPRSWQLTFTVLPAPLVLASDTVRPDQVESVAVYDTLRRTGGATTAASSWRVTDGALPAGWTLGASDGVVSGVTSDTGAFAATIELAAGADTTRRLIAWTVLPGIEVAASPWPDSLALGVARDDTLRALSRVGPLVWQRVSGALPDGVTFDTLSARLSGTPQREQPFEVVLRVRGGDVARTLRLQGVVSRRRLRIAWSKPDADVRQGDPLIDSMLISDGNGTAIGIVVDSLPEGITYDVSARRLTGRVRTVGTAHALLRVSQSGATDTVRRTYTVAPITRITTDSSWTFTVGAAATAALRVAPAMSDTVTFAFESGVMPEGLALAPNGTLTGAAAALGRDSARIAVTVARADGRYTASSWWAWQTVEPVIAAPQVVDALFGDVALSATQSLALDLLGNRNGSLDLGDVLRWLIRQGALPGSAAVRDVAPALQRLASPPPAVGDILPPDPSRPSPKEMP